MASHWKVHVLTVAYTLAALTISAMFQLETRSDVGNLQVELDNGWLCQLPVKPLDAGYVLQMGTIDLSDAQCAPLLEGQLAITRRDDIDE